MTTDHMVPTKLGEKQLRLWQALMLPGAFIVGLVALALGLPNEPAVVRAIFGAAFVLTMWTVWLYAAASSRGRTLSFEVVLFKHHWVQVCTQVALYGYWAWYVPSIRVFWPLILAQLLFAFAFHILLTWSRRDSYGLGFGPVPITLSFNLFILFRPEWFHWQFGIVALAFLAKELIRWDKSGRSAHIFNPSSFSLAMFSIVLILTGSSDMTLGVEIASTLFNPPHMYLVLVLVSIPVQILFGVTTMTIAAVVTTYAFGLIYFAATGTYLFFDSYIPIAVFIGMHLLITDPATSPRSESGRLLFGILYGAGTCAAFGLLRTIDAPAFYDKLLPVPILNLFVQVIDRAAVSGKLRPLDLSRIGRSLTATQRRVGFVGIWLAIFAGISVANGMGDEHPGQWVPFWQEACLDGSGRACDHLAVLQQNLCEAGSGWSCNELGMQLAAGETDRSEAVATLRRGCVLEFPAACENLERMAMGAPPLARARPLPQDLPVLLRGSKGPIGERNVGVLYALACERGWSSACESGFTTPTA